MTREQKILAARQRRAAGELLRSIAEDFGVSMTTVLRWTDDGYAERERALCRANKARYCGRCHDCGTPTVGSSPDHAPECCRRCRGERTRADSRRWILDSFREWHDLFGEQPTAKDWNPAQARLTGRTDLVERHAGTGRPWPSQRLVSNIFGSWNAGVRAAGFTPNRAGYYRDESKRSAISRAARGTEQRREDIAIMWSEGATVREIADALGVQPSTVYNHMSGMRRDGWDLPRRGNRSVAV